MSPGTLEAQIEEAALDLFADLGWNLARVMDETFGERGALGRETKGDVVLLQRLRPALEKLNPTLPPEAIGLAIEEITRDRSAMGTVVAANRDVYALLKHGVRVRVVPLDGDDRLQDVTVRVIDWERPEANDFLVAQQLWVQGEIYQRRADLVGFVNGLPLAFIELKGLHKNVETAYRENFADYLSSIPQIFWFNGLVVLSNGFESRIGSVTGAWEHFKEWKRIEREDEPPTVSLETMLRGVCDKDRLLDLIENFTLFSEQKSAVAKIIGQNHQFLGVSNAIAAVRKYQLASTPPGVSPEVIASRRRLGVFWHTQGSGKSFSMVFFSQKILRRLPGNWTFVIVTDREDLDDQIYKTFAACGAVKDKNVQAKSADHLKQLLTEDHRYVFTLIQKFRTDVKGAKYPKLSDRSDIIVVADEAHRSQYDTFAINMRQAMPNAAFIGFTGTPLMAGEEKTREVFGDYVSVYNFRQAIDDNATVPLYYEARIPSLQLTNEDLGDDLAALIEDADLNEEQEKKVEREFSRQYHLITREDRLDTIAADIVAHFVGLNIESEQPNSTKGMFVAIDKVTAVRMYDKVKAAWAKKKAELEGQLRRARFDDKPARKKLQATVDFIAKLDMAVVVSQSQGEVDAFKKKGVDIAPHRLRMMREDLDTKFKDPADDLGLVFVCAMWMTGFDVPSCGAVYLDKPMRNHSLMQTIARANRVYEGKVNGVIVDYVGVLRNLQKALAIYGAGAGGGVGPSDTPVQPKEVQFSELQQLIAEAKRFCADHGVDVNAIRPLAKLARITALKAGVDKLIHPGETRKKYLTFATQADRVYRALGLYDPKLGLAPDWGALLDLARGIQGLEKPVDISEVMGRVEKLLDESIDAGGYGISEPHGGEWGGRVHLGKIDFDALARYFAKAKNKATTAEALSSATMKRMEGVVHLNPTRRSLRDALEALIADYNDGVDTVAGFFERLLAFIKRIDAEERRPSAEGLSQEQLAFYDLLVGVEVTLSTKDKDAVKTIAADLPKRLEKRLVIDWRKSQMKRAAVRVAIKAALEGLPEAYDEVRFEAALEAVYEHVYESYWGEGKSKYVERATS
jgi:type I restriction enzyme R subunit